MQRLESIFIFLWVSVAVIRISMMLWASAYSFGRGFKWPSYRPGVPAFGLLAFALSLVPQSQMEVVQLSSRYLVMWGNVIVFGLPLLIVLIGWMQQPRRGQPGGRQRRTPERQRRPAANTTTE